MNIVKECTADDCNDVILSDRTDFSEVAKRLRKEAIFNNVLEISPKKLYGSKKWWQIKIMHIQDLLNVRRVFYKRYGLKVDDYDILYACNLKDPVVMELYSILFISNPNLKVYEIEDGYGTYICPYVYPDREMTILNLSYKLTRIPYLSEKKVDKILLYFPELYLNSDQIPRERLPLMDLYNSEIQGQLRRVFGCQNIHIEKKYVILEESFKVDGHVNNAEEWFTVIIDLVGEENVVLKTHPRNRGNSYHERRIQVFDAPIAWEAMIAAEDMDDKVFITCTSGSGINTKLLYHSKCKIVFLYKLIKGDKGSIFTSCSAQEYLDNFQKCFKNEVFVPESMQELKEIMSIL